MPSPPANKPDPIRVLLYSPKGAGLHYGGPGMTAFRMYSAAPPGRFDLTLVHAFGEQARYELFARQVPLARHWQGTLATWRLARRSARWVRAHLHEFDVFHGLQAFHVTVHTAIVAQRAGLPAVIKPAAHRTDFVDKGGLKDVLGLPRRRRAWIRELAGIIAISGAIADELLEYGVPEERIARIPNGVDIRAFRPPADASERSALRDELGWDERPTVLFSGVMTPRKRPHLVVEAGRALRDAGHECHLVFAGPFPEPAYEQRLRDFIAAHDLSAEVSMLGFRDDMARLYRAADVYALPSAQEGMPNALLEAMASGLPAVATPISGVTDLIGDEVNGLLVEPTADAMAEALGRYVGDASLRAAHGGANRRLVERRYSAESVAEAHARLFRRLMHGGEAAEEGE